MRMGIVVVNRAGGSLLIADHDRVILRSVKTNFLVLKLNNFIEINQNSVFAV